MCSRQLLFLVFKKGALLGRKFNAAPPGNELCKRVVYVCKTNTYRTLASRIARRCNPGDHQSSRVFLIGFDNTAANSVH